MKTTIDLKKLPKEVLVEYLESAIDLDTHRLNLLHRNYQHQKLSDELDKLREQAEEVKGDLQSYLCVQHAIDGVFEEMSKLSKSYSI